MQIFENSIYFAQIGQIRIGNQNRTIFKFGDCMSSSGVGLKGLQSCFDKYVGYDTFQTGQVQNYSDRIEDKAISSWSKQANSRA